MHGRSASLPALVTGGTVLAVALPLSRLPLPAAVVLPVVVVAALVGVVAVLALVQRPLVRDLAQLARRRPTAP
jgi:hypothetical protein